MGFCCVLCRLSQHCGVTGVSLDWLKSYLSGRSHRVSIDGTLSSAVALLWGVIQGSVVGAILYVVYVNPLAAIALLFGISIHQFSDDTQLRIRFRLIEELLATNTMSTGVSALLDWFFRNRVKTNVPNTELLYTSSSTRRIGPEPTPMTVAGATVPPSAAVKTLGVTLDEHLSMEQHVNNICKAAYYHLHLISKIRRCLTCVRRCQVSCHLHHPLTTRLCKRNPHWAPARANLEAPEGAKCGCKGRRSM